MVEGTVMIKGMIGGGLLFSQAAYADLNFSLQSKDAGANLFIKFCKTKASRLFGSSR